MTDNKKPPASKPQREVAEKEPTSNVQHEGKGPQVCGLIMPIAGNDVGSAEHWGQVRRMITDSLAGTGLKVQMVSESEEVNVIHNNIVTNVYGNDIVICDVSSRNPNVMFELGMRLSFDKPVVIIKDRETPFSFDVGNIQHLEYPRSLNYIEILAFQKELKEKTLSTLEASTRSGYSPFLSNYKIKQVSKIETEVVGREDYIISAVQELMREVKKISNRNDGQMLTWADSNLKKWLDKSNSSADKFIDSIVDEISAEVMGSGIGLDENTILEYCLKMLSRRYTHLSDSKRIDIARRVIDNVMPF